jgi:putative membrane protein
LSTLIFRWYVFFFWGVGLWLLSRAAGFPGALLRFLFGYGIAYCCEWSSARPGGWFPFGHYVYLPTTVHNEIWIGILPLMDSLSFDFLAVGALGLSGFISGFSLGETLGLSIRTFLPIFLRGVLMFVMIDMVIDPVSLRGDRWFLGRIYEYPDGGVYFGVTLANFAGWAVTGALIMASWRFLSLLPGLFPRSFVQERPEPPNYATGRELSRIVDRYGPLFIYGAVYLFNLAVAVWIEESGIVLADLLLLALFFFVFIFSPSSDGSRSRERA